MKYFSYFPFIFCKIDKVLKICQHYEHTWATCGNCKESDCKLRISYNNVNITQRGAKAENNERRDVDEYGRGKCLS